MDDIKERIENLGLILPETSSPGGNYSSVNIRGKIAYLAIQFPIFNGEFRFQGKLGDEITTKEGYEAAQLCALNVLSQVSVKIGFNSVQGLNHFDLCYRAEEDWDDSPKVANGASDLFVQILEEKGTHSRSIFGVESLPRNFAVGLTCSFTMSIQ